MSPFLKFRVACHYEKCHLEGCKFAYVIVHVIPVSALVSEQSWKSLLLTTMSVAQPLLATIEADEPSVENTSSAPRSERHPVAPQTARSPRQMATTESDAESGSR